MHLSYRIKNNCLKSARKVLIKYTYRANIKRNSNYLGDGGDGMKQRDDLFKTPLFSKKEAGQHLKIAEKSGKVYSKSGHDVLMNVKTGKIATEASNQSSHKAVASNYDAVKSRLRSYENKGAIERIRRNYYGVKSSETKQLIANRYMIGSNINETAYISFHSAFEYHGMANQIFYRVYISSEKRFSGFEHDGIEYQWVSSKINPGVITAGKVRVTDIERTVVDCIKDFEKCGGLEELLHCLSMITVADENKLLQYLTAYENQFLWQKAGYILSHFAKAMKLTERFFSVCRGNIKKSKRYLYEGIRYENPVYNAQWQLYVPMNLLNLIGEEGEQGV